MRKLPPRQDFIKRSKSQTIFSNAVITNPNKLLHLEEFENHFPSVNFDKILVVPILMNHKALMIKIESIYNQLAKEIMIKKKQSAIDLARVIETQTSQSNKSLVQQQQSLCDLLYSVKKYLHKQEVNAFFEMVTKKCSNVKVVFYLYFRQIFKLITASFFINDKMIESDPLNLEISRQKALEIIQEALYNYPELHMKFEGTFLLQIKQKTLQFYELMNFLWYSNLFEEYQDFFDDFIALYDFKNKPEIYRGNFKKNADETSKNVVKKQILKSEYDYYISQIKDFQRKARKEAEGQNPFEHKQKLDEELESRVRADTQRRQQQLDQKLMDFTLEGRNANLL